MLIRLMDIRSPTVGGTIPWAGILDVQMEIGTKLQHVSVSAAP